MMIVMMMMMMMIMIIVIVMRTIITLNTSYSTNQISKLFLLDYQMKNKLSKHMDILQLTLVATTVTDS